jgi:ubiquitin-like modifier-activating enzyme ATG7
MPGHPPAGPAQEAQQQADAAQLDQLVRDHDVVFLLTDTRESRWLPSLLCAAHGKLAVTSAVGFDSFVVMRHGAGVPQDGSGAASSGAAQGEQQQAAGSGADAPGASAVPSSSGSGSSHGRLGCYFCNDVVAPLNSTVDRSLDQQCTVARPGLAPVAGALAVELVAALLQHPLKAAAPASTSAADGAALGAVPHMVRGQLSAFRQVRGAMCWRGCCLWLLAALAMHLSCT